MDPVLGSLVYQLLGGVALACDLHLGNMIARWKGNNEDIHFGGSIKAINYYLGARSWKKCHLGPQNDLESLGPEKLLKIVNCQQTILS